MIPQGKVCSIGKDNGSYSSIGGRDYSYWEWTERAA